MASLGSLVIELAANTARLQTDMGKAVGIAQRGAQAMQASFRFLGGGLVGAGLLNMARQSIELGENLNKAALKAGVSGRAISELAYAAKQSDVDLQSLSSALQKMQVALSKAASGSKEQNAALAALGLTIEDIKSLSPDKQFELLADRIAQLRDPADRARAAVELFGKAGADLLPLLLEGAEGIKRLRTEAERLGQSFSTQQIKALDDAGDAVDRLNASWQAFTTTLTAKVAPSLTNVLNKLATAPAQTIGMLSLGLVAPQTSLMRDLTAPPRSSDRKGIIQRPGAAPPGFQAEAENAKKQAIKVKEAFELDPETLDRISFEDWRRETVQATDDVVRASQDMDDEMQRIGDDMQKSWGVATDELSEFGKQAARNIQDAFAQFFLDMDGGVKGFAKSFIDAMRSIVANKAAKELADLLGSFGKGGSREDKGGFLGDILGGLFGFANGGQFKVGGSGGTDSQLVAFKASPNETVTVTRPDQQRGGGAIVNYAPVFNISVDSRTDREAVRGDIVAIASQVTREGLRRFYDSMDRNGYPPIRF